MPSGDNGGVMEWAAAIVEFEDGTVKTVPADSVRFADWGEFHDTAFIPEDVLESLNNQKGEADGD